MLIPYLPKIWALGRCGGILTLAVDGLHDTDFVPVRYLDATKVRVLKNILTIYIIRF